MANEKKAVNAITDMEEDFAQWYTDVCKKAELIDYSSIKGMFIYRPYGYAIWENIQKELDRRFKETGHENVAMPMLIPESLLQKEKDHVEGFAPECAWVTHGGSDKLEERCCIRPTSETLFCEHFKNIIHSHRDLPKKYNQWCSVLRWEKTSRPFLRHREFLWQEGHTMHATEEDARQETMDMLNIYADFMENVLAMPVVKGRKTDKEKFNGAEETYTVECMMHDRKALQAGTSHYFGDGFARAFDITFTGKDNQLHHPHQTSWGVSTRMIGGIIMTHGDNNGLVLPPRIAPIQAMVIPVAQHKEGVLEAASALLARLKAAGIRAKMDDSDNSMGCKAAEYEMKGVPLRVEIGPKDMEKGQCCICRRDSGEKVFVPLAELETAVPALLDAVHEGLYARAKKNLEDHTRVCMTLDEVKAFMEAEGGFAKAFDITFTGKDNTLHYPHQTSWGVSTRMIGGIIMTHGDNSGLVLPPRIAPIQAMVIPVAQHKEGVLDAAAALLERLQKAGIRAKMDASEQSMGWKAAEYEMKGIPLRVEIGPKDMEKNQCVLVRRDSGEKVFVSLDDLETVVPATLDAIHDGLYQRAKKNLEDHIFEAHSLEEAKQLQAEHGGFIKTMWCGELDCELKMKEEAGMTSRCVPFAQEHLGDTCPICGRAAKKMIYWGVAY